jgi:hypothetical protein
MAVKLEKVPVSMKAPAAPRAWLCLLLLVVLLLFGLLTAFFFYADDFAKQPDRFWLIALGPAFLIWCLLSLIRVLQYSGEQGVVEGWNEAREADLAQKIRRGRRSQQVLAVSLHTALRESRAEGGEAQLDALQNGQKALTVQPDWQASEDGLRHSRLAYEQGESPETLLRRVLQQVSSDIADVLKKLPEDQPLALLLEMDSSVPESTLSELWQEVWSQSGIRQAFTLVEGFGLAVVDEWLDQRIHDEALLLVIAIQLAPSQALDSAEAVVGLLFGNRLTQTLLEPMAFLHRPERERGTDLDSLLEATGLALGWVPVEASKIQHVWVAGADSARTADVAEVLNGLQMLAAHRPGLHDLGVFLGNPGCTAPWVAIAASVELIGAEGAPQFIFNGENTADTQLWCSVVMPPSVS